MESRWYWRPQQNGGYSTTIHYSVSYLSIILRSAISWRTGYLPWQVSTS